MSPKHIGWADIDAYLADRLPEPAHDRVERHLASCSRCAARLQQAQEQEVMLGPTLKAAIGRPTLPPYLRERVQADLKAQTGTDSNRPIAWGALFNAAGAMAAIILLAWLAWTILRPTTPVTVSTGPVTDGPTIERQTTQSKPATVTPTATARIKDISILNTAEAKSFAIGQNHIDTATPERAQMTAGPFATPSQTTGAVNVGATEMKPSATPTIPPIETPPSPAGLIAFSFFNPAPNRQVYEIHLMAPDGTSHTRFPLDGVSEPALGFTAAGRRLAYRAWGVTTGPRSLLSGDLAGIEQTQVGGFWEDAQPDWSPIADRLIYASQREQDRRWRLYTSRGDGGGEIDLRLAGQRPSFAPDGQQFVYQGCDQTGNRCGLWRASLDSPQLAQPLFTTETANAADWSPINEQIVFMAEVAGNWDLYRLKADGSDLHRLTTDAAIDGLPTWSPDGNWLAFLSNRGGDWGIWRLHLESGALAKLFTFDGGSFNPAHGEPYGVRDWWDEQLSWGR